MASSENLEEAPGDGCGGICLTFRKDNEVFEPVMSVLRSKKWGIYGPTSFQGYAKKNGLTVPRTAEYISVDHMERLNSLLRREQAMVLRLGTAVDGPGTQFAVVKTPNRLHDYFLLEEQCFTETHPVTYLPSVSFRNLFPYYIFPKRTETSMVNLAFASGLIGHALNLDKPFPVAAPATGNSTYTFRFYAHSEHPVELVHINGQAEIDAVFVGSRRGKDCLFILESKSGANKSLAKHKLVYPVLALAPYAPADMPIIPVYLKVQQTEMNVCYHVVECAFPDPRRKVRSLNELTVVSHRCLSLPLPQVVWDNKHFQ